MEYDVIIRGTGRYVPERVLTNDDFARIVDTSDEWITARTGIKERHIVVPGETSSHMAEAAVMKALEMAGADPAEVELIIVPTVTPEHVYPATASVIQGRIGAAKAACFDMNAACSSFIYALNTATNFLRVGQYKNALVIGSDVMTSITNYLDRNTCVLFGDAAAVLYLVAEPRSETPRGIRAFDLGSDGTAVDILYQYAGGSAAPSTPRTALDEGHFVYMEGPEVFKRAVRTMEQTVRDVIAKENVEPLEVDWFLAHQANSRIIQSTQKRLQVPAERVYINIQRYGNTTSASIPLCIDELNEEGKLKPGNKVVLFAFGAGLSWASCYLIWEG
ncbi:ketoacyl-ACP synthase III [bacterium]|nr:ketoacyl-ACP synthase III [bacterium]